MIKIIALCLLVLFTSIMSDGQSIDANKSTVRFSISNMKVNTVKGSFTGMKGSINFHPKDLASSYFDVCISVASINTGNKKRDNHLREEDFFYADKYPNICFKSESITKTNSGYTASGKLTLRGITKSVQIPFTYSNNVFKGKFKVNRMDFNVGEETGSFMVGEDVTIDITCNVN